MKDMIGMICRVDQDFMIDMIYLPVAYCPCPFVPLVIFYERYDGMICGVDQDFMIDIIYLPVAYCYLPIALLLIALLPTCLIFPKTIAHVQFKNCRHWYVCSGKRGYQ